MAKSTLELIVALRATAERLDGGVKYQWTHMGRCNCGHLAQTLTKLSGREIHERALEGPGDWAEQMREYCAETNMAIDTIVRTMLAAGLTPQDVANLERLKDKRIARGTGLSLPLDHKSRADTIAYMKTWADQLEAEWKVGFEDVAASVCSNELESV